MDKIDKNRQITVVIKQKIQLDRFLGLPIRCPGKRPDTKFDQSGVKTVKFSFERKFMFGRDGWAMFQKHEKYILENLGILMSIGVGRFDLLGAFSMPR